MYLPPPNLQQYLRRVRRLLAARIFLMIELNSEGAVTPARSAAPPSTEAVVREIGGSDWHITRRQQLDAECQPLPNLPLRIDVEGVPEDASEDQLRALRQAVARVAGDETDTRALGLKARAVLYCSIGQAKDCSPEVAASLYACYVVLIQWANEQEPPAIIVCPDWRKYPGSEIFQKALNHVGFQGPFVTVVASQSSILEPGPPHEAHPGAWKSAQTWVCREADQDREPEANLEDWQLTCQQGELLDGATHCITVRGLITTTNACHASVAARLVRVLCRGEPQGITSMKAKPSLAFLSNGGRSCLAMLSPVVNTRVPLLLFAGSGRLADVLPDFYLGRLSADASTFKVAQLVAQRTGYAGDVNHGEGVRIGEILSGTLFVHEVSSSMHSLKRLLARYGSDHDRALLDAKRRRSEYQLAARKLHRGDLLLQLIYLVGSFVTTALATAQTAVMMSERCQRPDESCEGVREKLQYTIAALPILLAIFFSIRQDLNFAPQVIAFEFAAASIDQEIYKYVTNVCEYSDAEAMRRKERDASAARTARLCSEIVRISTQSISDDSLTDSSALMRKLVPAASKGPVHVRPSAAGAQEDKFASKEDRFDAKLQEKKPDMITMDTNAYVEQRVRPQQEFLERRAIVLRRRFVVLKVFTYAIGAVGSILALHGHEEWVVLTTAAAATAATLNAGAPVEEQLARTRRGARRLANLLSWYGSLTVETTMLQPNMDHLVGTAERAILATMLAPNADGGDPEAPATQQVPEAAATPTTQQVPEAAATPTTQQVPEAAATSSATNLFRVFEA